MANDDNKSSKQPTPPPSDTQPNPAPLPTTQAPLPSGTTPPPVPRVASSVGMVKITNKHTAPLGLPPLTRERGKQLGHELQGDHLDRFLQPGENTIPAEHWRAVKGESPVRNWIEDGMLHEGADRDTRPEPTGTTFRESLGPLPEPEAQKYIDASTDPAQLSKWAETERRPPVRDAIQRRMDALGAGK